MVGRPSSYTTEMGELICQRLVCGKDDRPESLRSICRDDDMPDLKTVMRWIIKEESFRQQYACAREAQQEMNHEEIIEIADNATDDIIFLTQDDGDGESGKPVIKHSAIARAKLQIDTRKWVMSKMAAKKYGDKVALNHGGQDGENPVKTSMEVCFVRPSE